MGVISDYLSNVSLPQRDQLEHICKLVTSECPDATEAISYGMPGYKYLGKYLITFSSFKDHLSIFPGSEPIEILADKLEGFKTSKGTIQFTATQPISDELLTEIILLCKQRIDRGAKKP